MKIQKLNSFSWELDGQAVMMRNQQDFKDFVLKHKKALASIAQKALPSMKKFPSGSLVDIEANCDAANFIEILIDKIQDDNNSDFVTLSRAFLQMMSLIKVVVYVNNLNFYGEDEKNYPLVTFILYHCKQAVFTTESDWLAYQQHLSYVIALKSSSPIANSLQKLKEMPKGKKLPEVPLILVNPPQNYVEIEESVFTARVIYGMSKILMLENSSDVLVEFFGVELLNPFVVDFNTAHYVLDNSQAEKVNLNIGGKNYQFTVALESFKDKNLFTLRLNPKQIVFNESDTLTDVVIKLME